MLAEAKEIEITSLHFTGKSNVQSEGGVLKKSFLAPVLKTYIDVITSKP